MLGRILSVLVILGLLFLVWLFWNFKILRAEKIDITLKEISCAGEPDIRRSLEIEHSFLMSIDEIAIEKKLKGIFPCIKNIQIQKKLPNRVEVDVFGRVPVITLVVQPQPSSTPEPINLPSIASGSAQATVSAQIQDSEFFDFSLNDTKNLIVDPDGFIFATGSLDNTLKVFYLGDEIGVGRVLKNNAADKTIKILEWFSKHSLNVDNAKIINQEILSIKSLQKFIFSLDKDTFSQLASLQLILSEAKINLKVPERIDLRFDKPVVVYSQKK